MGFLQNYTIYMENIDNKKVLKYPKNAYKKYTGMAEMADAGHCQWLDESRRGSNPLTENYGL